VQRSLQAMDSCDLALLVCAGGWDGHEKRLLQQLLDRQLPTIVVFNKSDCCPVDPQKRRQLQKQGLNVVETNALNRRGIDQLKEKIRQLAPPSSLIHPTIVGDLIQPGQLVVLVTPIDLEAPTGRLILPQVQTIRDVLDNDALCLMVKERELRLALDQLRHPPALVVTDSQAFLKVAADVPEQVAMTSFSILFARLKGDLCTFVRGARTIDQLRPGSRVLVAEACSHHVVGDDIGRVKIPRWLRQYVGGPLQFSHVQGQDFPEDLSGFDLVIHCGACTINRRQMHSRIARCQRAGVPITNYGLTIAYSLGIFERALQPFPDALAAYRQS
ncbi:[FeFe] hydrogenase H-cluster maturation GTPase HydF, partial [Candidatus Parcubacteria bacterium]